GGRGVLLPVPRRLARVEAVGGGAVGVESRLGVEERVDQRDRGEVAGVAQRGDQGEVATGAVAVGVRWLARRRSDAPAAGTGGEPAQDGVDVVGGGREAVLG